MGLGLSISVLEEPGALWLWLGVALVLHQTGKMRTGQVINQRNVPTHPCFSPWISQLIRDFSGGGIQGDASCRWITIRPITPGKGRCCCHRGCWWMTACRWKQQLSQCFRSADGARLVPDEPPRLSYSTSVNANIQDFSAWLKMRNAKYWQRDMKGERLGSVIQGSLTYPTSENPDFLHYSHILRSGSCLGSFKLSLTQRLLSDLHLLSLIRLLSFRSHIRIMWLQSWCDEHRHGTALVL